METLMSLSCVLCASRIDVIFCNKTPVIPHVFVKQQRCCCVWIHPEQRVRVVAYVGVMLPTKCPFTKEGIKSCGSDGCVSCSDESDESCLTPARGHLVPLPLRLNLHVCEGPAGDGIFVDFSLSSIATAIASHRSVPSAWLPQLCWIRN